MSTALRAYLNDPALKAAFLDQIAQHEAADAIVQGTYGQINGAFRGCAIGCALHSLNLLQGKVGEEALTDTSVHARYETELGLPAWLAHLEDHIFESLPIAEAVTWPRRLAEAIPVGAVVGDRALARILLWLLTDATYGARTATDREDVRGWIDKIAAWIAADARGEATDEQSARAARAAWAAWAARDAWAAWDAWAARDAWADRAVWDAKWDTRFCLALAAHVVTVLQAVEPLEEE